MGLFEGLLYMMWRGLAIGIIISAPMGPVGILCVQRTLEKGRKTGFYTGVGAALSDIVYCLLTGFGLSFIEEFLERNSNIIQMLGSLVLIGFGIYLFKSNPSKNLKRPSDKNIPAGKNILSGFLFTFSNPLIIFLIIGLFARFNFLLPEITFFHYILGFLFIIGGALLWWWIVTYFVDKVRAHFNLRSMWLINKITGSVILLFAIVGIITAISGMVNAAEPMRRVVVKKDKIEIHSTNSEAKAVSLDLGKVGDFEMRFRIRNNHNAEHRSYKYEDTGGKTQSVQYPAWTLRLGSSQFSPTIKVQTQSDTSDPIYSSPTLKFTLNQNENIIADRAFTAGFNVFEGLNAYRIRVKEGTLTMWGGNKDYELIMSSVKLDQHPKIVSFEVGPGGDIYVEHLSIRETGMMSLCNDSLSNVEVEIPELEMLKKQLSSSKDEKEGVWGLLDYNVEDKYLKLGGEYVVAIVKEENKNSSKGDIYNIHYVSGASKYPDSWNYGALKGKLYSTVFPNIFNMEWLSAKGEKIQKNIKVEFDNRDMLVNIPEYSSSIRFRKINPED